LFRKRYWGFTRSTVTELAGNVCWNCGATFRIVSSFGATFFGLAKEFSSSPAAEVNRCLEGRRGGVDDFQNNRVARAL